MELYVHIPFCIRKCLYCDFLSFPGKESNEKLYCAALLKEIESADMPMEEITSIFVGGGTPTLLSADEMAKIFQGVYSKFSVTEDCEITIEANPGTLTMEKLKAYREMNINRISIGCQSLNDWELKQLGRIHTEKEFLESYDCVRQAGFNNVNIDLMSAIPGQDFHSWEKTLRQVADLKPEHISAYSLIIEEGTPFAAADLPLPSEEEERRMYESTGDILKEYGYGQYEISNYALSGKECRHNIGYWKRDNYLGLGLGAASLLNNRRFNNTDNMEEYLKYSSFPEKIRRNQEILSAEEQQMEFMMLGLRMNEGVSKREFYRLYGISIDAVYGTLIEKFEKLGLMETSGDRIAFTSRGVGLSNQFFLELI